MGECAAMSRSWRELYKAAVFEPDMSKLPSRIEQARNALVLRSRELFATSADCDGETEAKNARVIRNTAGWPCE
jgi:hypothetical protein